VSGLELATIVVQVALVGSALACAFVVIRDLVREVRQ
jgi:hypothetical protein